MRFHIDNRNTTDPHVNLALEEYSVRNLPAEHDYLLLYTNTASVIVGRHQNIFEEVNLKLVQGAQIPVVRRISGGGAVYHDPGNLNYCFIKSIDRLGPAQTRNSLRPVIDALHRMGLAAEIDDRNAIRIAGQKISGTAQFSNTRRVMVHGTLLFDTDLETLTRVLHPPVGGIRSKSLKSIRSPVANLSEWIKPSMDMDRFSRRFLRALAAADGDFRPHVLSHRQWHAIHELAEKKYRSWRWNYAKAPEFEVHRSVQYGAGTLEIRIAVREGTIQSARCAGGSGPESFLRELEYRLQGIRYDPDEIVSGLKTMTLTAVDPSMTPGRLAAILY